MRKTYLEGNQRDTHLLCKTVAFFIPVPPHIRMAPLTAFSGRRRAFLWFELHFAVRLRQKAGVRRHRQIHTN